MAVDEGLVAWVEEAMAPLGAVTGRAMMGGKTLYCDSVVFAIVALDALWFKADKLSDAEWDAERCDRFTFDMGGKTGSMNYRRAPDDCYDDADEFRRWAALAVAAGQRAATAKRPRSARSAAR